jgi:hypothetical protein
LFNGTEVAAAIQSTSHLNESSSAGSARGWSLVEPWLSSFDGTGVAAANLHHTWRSLHLLVLPGEDLLNVNLTEVEGELSLLRVAQVLEEEEGVQKDLQVMQ